MLALLLAVPAARADAADGRYIVRTATGEAPSVAAGATRTGADVIHEYRVVLHGFAADMTAERAAALRQDPRVVSVEPDGRSYAATTQTSPPWGLDRIDQRPAAGDGAYNYDTTGSGVTVFVIDTGVRRTHTEFGGRVGSGYDFVDGDADASDCSGHGTHVSGTVGGATYGVAKAVKMVAVRIWDCDDSGWQSDMIAALDSVVAHEPGGPTVVNISGGGDPVDALDDAVAATVAAGIPVVVAAMNGAVDACAFSPARAPAAIAVGATDQADARAPFSDFGPCVDLWAPGVGILSSVNTSDTASEYWSGTSMAAPHVTGVIGRYLEGHPSATPAEVRAYLGANATPGAVADAQSPLADLLFAPPPAYVAPTVTARRPADGARNVGPRATVALSFSKAMARPATQAAFSLVRASDGGVVPGTFAWTGATMTFKPSEPLVAASRYRYEVTTRALDAAGDPLSAGVSAIFATGTVPGPPRSVTASAGAASATVAWRAPASNGGVGIRSYTVTAAPGDRVVTVGSWARTARVTGLAAGTAYTFTVTAANPFGAGAPSAPSGAVTPTP